MRLVSPADTASTRPDSSLQVAGLSLIPPGAGEGDTTMPDTDIPQLSDAEAEQLLAGAIAAGVPEPEADAPKPDEQQRVEDLPHWAQKIIRDTRQEAATHRTAKTAAEQAAEQKQRDMVLALAKAAGVELPGQTPDPEKLAADLTAAQTSARDAAIQLAVYKTAGAVQGNPDALLDSNTFLAKVRTLDPTAADFGAQVSEAIKAAVAANPSLKQTRAVGASTVSNAGGTGEQGQYTAEQVKKMTPEEIVEAKAKGLLRDYIAS